MLTSDTTSGCWTRRAGTSGTRTTTRRAGGRSTRRTASSSSSSSRAEQVRGPWPIELATYLHEVSQCLEKAPTRPRLLAQAGDQEKKLFFNGHLNVQLGRLYAKFITDRRLQKSLKTKLPVYYDLCGKPFSPLLACLNACLA